MQLKARQSRQRLSRVSDIPSPPPATPNPPKEKCPLMKHSVARPQKADKIVGQRIRAVRLHRGLSQTALAKPSKLTFQQIQKYEIGANRVATSRLIEFANTLSVPARYFLEGLDDASASEFDAVPSCPEEIELLRNYRASADAQRQALLNISQQTAQLCA